MSDDKEPFSFDCDGSVRDTEYEALKGSSSINTVEGLKPKYQERTERVLDESKRGKKVHVPYVNKKYKVLVHLSGRISPNQRRVLGQLFGEK